MGLDITSNSKNPYEIRLSLLQEARQILEHDFFQEQSKAKLLYTYYLEKGYESSAITLIWPKPITVAQILDLASELKTFVDNKAE